MAIIWRDEVYSVFGAQDLDNKGKWTVVLAGRLGTDEHGGTVFGL